MMKNKPIILFVIFSFFLLLFILINFNLSPSVSAQTSDSSDAIAVRIIPNRNHYSISRWYDSQGFKGAPQTLTVDGYEAIRDGRTVYVNASKVDVDNKIIYTNIYLISYNQEPSAKTIDILGQIVKYWKFNDNIPESSPSCSISSIPCLSDTDCAKNQVCGTTGIASSSCQLKVTRNCLVDPDCPNNFFCDSVKAKVIRDIKRVGKLEELKEALYRYKLEKGIYPRLPAGSYLADHAVSIWPSWLNTFLPQIAMTESFVDPINRLGACPGFDVTTCWNKDTQRFVGTSTATYLALPGGSYGFVYKTDANGSKYNLCAVMETRENIASLHYEFSPDNPADSVCVLATGILSGGNATNTPPHILSASFTGLADEEFNGSVKVTDDQGNPLTWNLNTSTANWSLWPLYPWSAAPILKDTSNPNQKKIYAVRAGGPGSYPITLTVSDGMATGTLSTSTSIVITNPSPFVEADNGEFALNPGAVFSYSFYFSDNNLEPVSGNSNYSLSKISGPTNLFPSPMTITPVAAGINRYKVTATTTIATSPSILTDTDFLYRLTVYDKYGSSTVKNFKITLKVTPPALTFNCPSNIRLGSLYSCFLGYTNQGNHQVSYSSDNLPAGFTITVSTTTNEFENNNINAAFSDKLQKLFHRLLALILPSSVNADSSFSPLQPAGTKASVYLKGTSTALFNQDVIIRATNEYGTYSTKTFRLNINNYCGDHARQIPNTEGRGGMYNDGYEDCDGSSGATSGTTQDVTLSNMNLQYGCSTKSTDITPFPIYNNVYCVYKSPTDNGGFCGDGYCSASIKFGQTTVDPFETAANCPEDCDPNCSPVCGNKVCGSNNCGGSCGTCPVGQTCNNSGFCEALCTPQCTGRECGPDTCGGVCQPNNCGAGEECLNGICQEICIPECERNSCDDDGCGGTCSCNNPDAVCCSGQCKPAGFKPCGTLCCHPGTNCCFSESGRFECRNTACEVGDNALLCGNKECGPDGQGGSCGTCPSPQICSSAGKCCTGDCHTCSGLTSINWALCGGTTCCNQNTEVCCNGVCQPNGSYILCGSSCCQPGDVCYGGKCLGR